MTTVEDYVDLDDVFERVFDRPDDCSCEDELVVMPCNACYFAGFGSPNPEVAQ